MKRRNVKAFTVVELVIVIAVIAVLAAVMIPTFGALIEKANISADEAEITSLNTQLAINEVENAEDLYDLIKETYGEAKATNFAPRSAKYGLSYYYDVEKNQIVLSTYSDLDTTPQNSPEAENKTANKVVLLGATTEQAEPDVNETTRNSLFYDAHKDDIRMHKNRYFCLDLSGIIGDMLVAMESGDTTAIEAAKEALTEAAQAFNKAAEHFQAIADALDLRLDALAKLESFTVTADKGISAGDTIYVPYDVKTLTLTAKDFVSDNGGELGEATVAWASSNSLATVDANGTVTLTLPEVGADSEVAITATATVDGGESKVVTKTIVIVRINAATITTEFGDIELDTTGDVSSVTITYDGTKDSFSMGNISASSNNYPTIEGIELDDTLSFELGEGNVFTIDGNNLVLTKEEFGTQNLTIKVGDYITDTVAIEVVDNSSSPFEVNDITEDVKMGATYLFRVGNGNAFTLDKLFNTEKAPDSITLNIFDASKTSGTGTLNAIATSGSGFTATYTSDLTKDTWASSTIKFSGTGVAIIEIITEKGTATLAVEVVNGKNVTAAGDFSGATNYVLLNDITWGTTKDVAISGTIYGNGFEISATAYQPAVSGNTAMFKLTGGIIDNLVINGPVYPSVSYSGEQYYIAGIYATGDAKITNSYISGFRQPIMANGTSLYLDNTTLVGGNYANLWLQTGTLTLKDVTTVQNKTPATIGSGTVMGLGIIASGTSQITIIGELNQYNWATEADVSLIDENVRSVASQIFKNSTLTHTVNGTKYANTGIVFLGTGGTVNNANQTNNTYYGTETLSVTVMGVSYTGKVYTRTTTNGAIASVPTYSGHTPEAQAALKPTFKHNLTLTNGEVSLKLANGSATLTVSGYEASKYTGQSVTVNVSCTGGTIANGIITFTQAGTYTLTYTVEDNTFFDNVGNRANGTVTDTYTVSVVVSKAEHKNAEIDLSGLTYKAGWSVSNLNGGNGVDDYSGCYAVLDGIKVYDYDANGNKSEITITADNLNGLTITASDSEVTHVITTEDGVYWLVDSKADNNKTNKSITFTYSYKGSNGNTVAATSNAFSLTSSDSRTGPTIVSGGSCVTPDTLITLADGTQVRVDSLTGSELLLVWNMETGMLDSAPIMFVDSDPESEYEVIKLYFSDNTEVKVISEHGFWDYDLNKYVYLDENASEYIGHWFAKQNGDKLEKVQLVEVVIETELTEAWSPVTQGHLCYFVNGMLSMPGGVGGLFNIFDVDAETMTYDYEALARDIDTYGLFTYEEMNAIVPLSEDMFNMAGGAYLKISIGKGNMTMDDLIYMIQRYSVYFD